MPSIANITSSIVKPRITGHFELKQSMIQLLYSNGQFMGLPHEDPQQHILNFLEISDTYITNRVTPDYVRLTLFPFSLLGEAKRWLKKAGESLYSAWERFKGLIRDCPHHNQTRELLAHTFVEGLHLETKIVVDAAAGGVLELDVVSALSAQISTLTNQVNQMTMVINKQQARPVQQVQVFCEVCGEGNMSNLCSANPESVYFVGNANRGQTNQPPQAEQQASPTSHLEKMMKKLMADQQNLTQKLMADQQAQAVAMRNLEHQVGQLASALNTRPVRALPSDIEPNPKAQSMRLP
ncbi:PREDICTED: uncharacterized protein LOC109220352 [Nicotiana attenuata]|uniref:uncharacterized protein LOC109220352 n=1 Tax=Nicotiana attenuata TaxID=49451 RepID=UPI00090508AA|nr:PREDICTED: uncharacterized protein LOC109220352 [Nicotiana attenuata]